MGTKAERITELLGIIENKSERIKKLKLECGQQSTQICVLNLRIEEIETQLEQYRWIPVNEEMPSKVSGHWGSEIVFATDGKQAWACKYNYSAEYWTAPSGDITHWKPIVLPPKG